MYTESTCIVLTGEKSDFLLSMALLRQLLMQYIFSVIASLLTFDLKVNVYSILFYSNNIKQTCYGRFPLGFLILTPDHLGPRCVNMERFLILSPLCYPTLV